MSKPDKQKGAMLFLTIVALSLMTSALLALVAINLGQTRTIINVGYSTIAFYAADSGIEQILYEIFKGGGWAPELDAIDDRGHYLYPLVQRGNNCDGDDWQLLVVGGEVKYQVCVSTSEEKKIVSTGDYRGSQRKLEINLEN